MGWVGFRYNGLGWRLPSLGLSWLVCVGGGLAAPVAEWYTHLSLACPSLKPYNPSHLSASESSSGVRASYHCWHAFATLSTACCLSEPSTSVGRMYLVFTLS